MYLFIYTNIIARCIGNVCSTVKSVGVRWTTTLSSIVERLPKSFRNPRCQRFFFSVVTLPYHVELTCHGAFIESLVLCMTFRHGYYVTL